MSLFICAHAATPLIDRNIFSTRSAAKPSTLNKSTPQQYYNSLRAGHARVDRHARVEHRQNVVRRLIAGLFHIIANVLLLLSWHAANTVGKILLVLSIAVCVVYVVLLVLFDPKTKSDNNTDGLQDVNTTHDLMKPNLNNTVLRRRNNTPDHNPNFSIKF